MVVVYFSYINLTYYSLFNACLSPRVKSLCGYMCLGSWILCSSHFKIEFRTYARLRQWCTIFLNQLLTASIKPKLLFAHADVLSWGVFLSLKYITENTSYLN